MSFLNRGVFQKSEVSEFYRGKTIFITGATGFLGKCLVEKLLRSCPDIKRIYFLIRGKKKYSAEERKKKFLEDVVFESLRKINPSFEDKITAVEGDLTSENLGLSEKDSKSIKNETNIIIHNAANVIFDIKISAGLKINVFGTKFMLELAQECKNIEVFMYVSTAYSNCWNKEIEEIYYPAPATLDEINEIIKRDTATEEGLSDREKDKILGKFPNVYCFSKSMAEDLVKQYSLKNPKCAYGVYRPSVVISAVKEPAPGFTDNTRGPVLIFLGVGLGVIHATPYTELPLDLIPSDYTINALIAVTRDCSDRGKIEQKPLVYNYGSTTVNPVTIRQLYDHLKNLGWTDASKHGVWMNFNHNYKSLWMFWVANIIFHFIPACMVDLVLIATGKKPRAVSMFMFAAKHMSKITYFSNGNWKINMPNTIGAIEKFNSEDKKLFYSDLSEVSWEQYSLVMWRGLKEFILKEDPDSPEGPRKYAFLYYLHYTLLYILLALFSYYMLRLLNIM